MTREQNQRVYMTMCNYLVKILPEGIQRRDLNKYLVSEHEDIDSLETIYEQFLFSAQNYRGMPQTIKFVERKDDIKQTLHNYNFDQIIDMGAENLYRTFRAQFNVTSADNNYNSWLKWSKSAVTAAKFMKEFHSVEDFVNFVQVFDYNLHTRMGLPLLIAKKIYGLDFALACDVLKELGFTNYCKPDVHIMDVLEKTGMSTRDPIEAFETMTQMARDCNVTPYKLDKVMWLICSGDFYLDNIRISRHKNELIDVLNNKLQLNPQNANLNV